MYNNAEDSQTYYEQKIMDLSTEIINLKKKIKELHSTSEKKDKQIDRLNNENTQIRAQLHKLQLSSSTGHLTTPNVIPQSKNVSQDQPAAIIPQYYPNQQMVSPDSYDTSSSIKKRECPKCGAIGFAIKEFEDKTRIISYIPRRIYAMKRVCTKCKHEF